MCLPQGQVSSLCYLLLYSQGRVMQTVGNQELVEWINELREGSKLAR